MCHNSQGVMVDQTLYITGCIGLDPTTASLVPGGIEPETERVCFLFIYYFNKSYTKYTYKR